MLPTDLKTLTTFRFFAAFWVFLFHVKVVTEFEEGWFLSIIQNGARGVDFFFILSGFVIFHVYEGQINAGSFSFRAFLKKRIARIYPLHVVMLLVFVVLTLGRGDPMDGFFQSLFLLHAFATTDGLVFNDPSWTISAELFAYVLFGLLVVRNVSTLALVVAFVVLAVLAHLLAVSLGKPAFVHMTWDFGGIRILPLFVLGMILRRLAPLSTPIISGGIGVVGLILLVLFIGREAAAYALLLPFSCLIVAGANLSDRAWLPTNWSAMTYLGEISYSTYMVHIFVIELCFIYAPRLGVPPMPWQVVGLIVVIASAVSYHLVERPARTWINSWGRS